MRPSTTQAADPVRNLACCGRVIFLPCDAAVQPGLLERSPCFAAALHGLGRTNGIAIDRVGGTPAKTTATSPTAPLIRRAQSRSWSISTRSHADPGSAFHTRPATTMSASSRPRCIGGKLDPACAFARTSSTRTRPGNLGFAQTWGGRPRSRDRLGLPRPSGMPWCVLRRPVGGDLQRSSPRSMAPIAPADTGPCRAGGLTQFQENALACVDTAAHVDVLAIAPYFKADTAGDPKNVEATLALTRATNCSTRCCCTSGQGVSPSVRTQPRPGKHGLRLKLI